MWVWCYVPIGRIRALKKYDFEIFQINSLDGGVPQSRTRIYGIGIHGRISLSDHFGGKVSFLMRSSPKT